MSKNSPFRMVLNTVALTVMTTMSLPLWAQSAPQAAASAPKTPGAPASAPGSSAAVAAAAKPASKAVPAPKAVGKVAAASAPRSGDKPTNTATKALSIEVQPDKVTVGELTSLDLRLMLAERQKKLNETKTSSAGASPGFSGGPTPVPLLSSPLPPNFPPNTPPNTQTANFAGPGRIGSSLLPPTPLPNPMEQSLVVTRVVGMGDQLLAYLDNGASVREGQSFTRAGLTYTVKNIDATGVVMNRCDKQGCNMASFAVGR